MGGSGEDRRAVPARRGEIAYELESDLTLAKGAVIEAEKGERGWTLRADCPRCDHPIATFVPARGVAVGLSIMDDDDKEPSVATFRCNCTHAHAGRPNGLSGCGFYWSFEISTGA